MVVERTHERGAGGREGGREGGRVWRNENATGTGTKKADMWTERVGVAEEAHFDEGQYPVWK